MSLKKYTPLALFLEDKEDVQAASALLQDSVMKIGDIHFDKEAGRFAFVANRFNWELTNDKSTRGPFYRTRIGVHFDDVEQVQIKNIRQDNKDAILDLLRVDIREAGDERINILLEFADHATIALKVGAISGQVDDLSDPWPTPNKPDHQLS